MSSIRQNQTKTQFLSDYEAKWKAENLDLDFKEFHDQERSLVGQAVGVEEFRRRKQEAAQLKAESLEQKRRDLFTKPSIALAEQCTPYTGSHSAGEVSQLVGQAVSKMRLALADKGITLTTSGLQKFANVLSLNTHNVDSTSASNLQKVFEHMGALGAFTQTDVGQVEQSVEPDPMAEAQERINNRSDAENDQILFSKYLNEIETHETETREGQREAKRRAFEAMLLESKPLFSEFRSHMRSVWNHPMAQNDCDAVVNFCVAHNLGFSHKAFDLARQQVLGCLTEDEQLARHIENHNDSPIDSYHVRRDISKRIHELNS